ncbi:MAG: prolipoprotein diacylglyceryl transferase [Brevinematales bacterium]|jgi:phosphatidylglycerol:prolipoprotein diacylglycerol transferase
MHPIEAFLIQPDINPLILQIWGPFAIRWYSLMYVLGFMFTYFYIYYQIKKGKIKTTEMELSDIIFYAFLGVIIGGRLGYVLFYNLGVYMQNPLDIFKIWEGGLSFHGGFIGVLISEWIYLSAKKKTFLDYADVFVVPLPFCLFLGRWGNFVNGELWGRPTTMPWGMIFRNAPGNLPRHPSQIYEMALEGLLLFIILLIISRLKHKPRGLIISSFFAGYGLFRGFVEFFREPDAQLGYLAGGWLTMGMVLCIPMILIGAAGIYYSLKLNRKNHLWA